MTTDPQRPSATALGYTLGVLVVVYTLNFIDRQIFAILLPSLQAELNLNDTWGGFLGGTAFALFYATLGIPIAWLADRSNRRNLIAWALAIWSAMTALCGLAQNVWQLSLARIGVGVGEAGCSPPAHSLLADYFPPERRGTALSIYSLGIPLGIMFGLFAGGWLDEFFGWRTAFLVVGLPGLVVALLVRFTLKEPRRGQADGNVSVTAPAGIAATFAYLRRRRAFVHLSFGAALAALAGYSIANWLPAFLVRSHAMGSAEIGTVLGLIFGIAGGAGIFLGGFLADRLGARDTRWRLWVATVAFVGAAPFFFLTFLSESKTLALLGLCIPMLLSNFYQATSFAQTQNLAPVAMRSTAAAMLLFVINIIGLGIGPLASGYASDLLTPRFGDDALRFVLVAMVFVYLWSAWHFFIAGRHLRGDLPTS
ncbi:MAG: MFS transporter [Pseudomonadota bacterium]